MTPRHGAGRPRLRFEAERVDAFSFIPQGGGDHFAGHRCAGEWLTIEVMKLALRFLTQRMSYDVPAQDLSFSLSRMPTRPHSGFIMREVRALRAPDTGGVVYAWPGSPRGRHTVANRAVREPPRRHPC